MAYEREITDSYSAGQVDYWTIAADGADGYSVVLPYVRRSEEVAAPITVTVERVYSGGVRVSLIAHRAVTGPFAIGVVLLAIRI